MRGKKYNFLKKAKSFVFACCKFLKIEIGACVRRLQRNLSFSVFKQYRVLFESVVLRNGYYGRESSEGLGMCQNDI